MSAPVMIAQDAQRKRELSLIHIARVQVGWDKPRYVAELMGRYGVDSSAGLNAAQREDFIKIFKGLGFKVKPSAVASKSQTVRDPMVGKLRAMWYALADVGAVARPVDAGACDKALLVWAQRQLPALAALRFISGAQAAKLVEEMKAWGARVGAKVY
jgi:Protein of unknown function (DUF1018)